MTEIRLEFVSAGFRQILTGGGVRSLVESVTDQVRDNAGDGYKSEVFMGNYGGGRWVGYVSADTELAKKAEAEDKRLTGAL